MIAEDVRKARHKLVPDHFHDEVRQEWDDVLATFAHPHYEIIPTMQVHDGGGEFRGHDYDSRVAFPDQNHEMIALRHCADAVITELWPLGTHLGPLGPGPADRPRISRGVRRPGDRGWAGSPHPPAGRTP